MISSAPVNPIRYEVPSVQRAIPFSSVSGLHQGPSIGMLSNQTNTMMNTGDVLSMNQSGNIYSNNQQNSHPFHTMLQQQV